MNVLEIWNDLHIIKWALSAEVYVFKVFLTIIHAQLSKAGEMRKTEVKLLFTNDTNYNVIQY